MMRFILLCLLTGSVAYANEPVNNQVLSASIDNLLGNSTSDFLTKPNPAKFQELSDEYYPQQDLTGKPNVHIGMTAHDVKHNSNWGEPSEVRTIVNQFGTHETWIYGKWDKLLQFNNGRVAHIQY